MRSHDPHNILSMKIVKVHRFGSNWSGLNSQLIRDIDGEANGII